MAASVGLVALACLAGGARAEETITSKMDITPPAKQLNAEDWRAISLAGTNVLKHVDQAVDALADKKNDGALKDIDQGLTLVKIIDGVLPTSTVKTEITGAGVTYTDQEEVTPMYVPLYREYGVADVISPVTARVQAQARKGAAKPPGSAPTETVPEVTYATSDYTSVKLNVRLAKRDLQAARDLIQQNDLKGATAALEEIQADGTIFEFSEMDRPLVRAMDNLRLAEFEVNNNRPDQARVALSGAADALKNYQAMAGSSRGKEVAKLHDEIDAVSKDINQQKPETFSKKVSGWWGDVRSWLTTKLG